MSQKHNACPLFTAAQVGRVGNSCGESIKAFGIRLWKFNSMHFFQLSVNNNNKKHETTAKTI